MPFALSSVGRYAHKLPDDPKGILLTAGSPMARALESAASQPLEVVLREKTCRWARVWDRGAWQPVAALENATVRP